MDALKVLTIGIVACIVLFACGSGGFILDKTGVPDVLMMEAEADIAQAQANEAKARADRIQAEAALAKAEADTERAKGDAEAKVIQARAESTLYEAAAASVRKDSRLVAWYAVRSDVIVTILVVASIPIQFAVGAIAGSELYKRYKHCQRA